jgi:hypothetical protein
MRDDHDDGDEKIPDPPDLRQGMYEVVEEGEKLPNPPDDRSAPEAD